MNKTAICIAAISLIASGTNAEQQVYKSIDAEGKVTYSSTPPTGGTASVVEQIPIAPPPSEAQLLEAEQRMRELEQKTEGREQQRTDKKERKEAAIVAAKKDLEAARNDLEQARIKTVDDWQTLATGGRVVKQSYFDRVERAEQRVKAAENALKKAARPGR